MNKLPLTSLIAALMLMLVSPLWAQTVPEKLIRDTTESVLQSIKNNKQAYQDDPSKLYQMVDDKVLHHFDFDRMTDLALGRYKRKVEKEQKADLVQAFRALLVRTYGKALLEYTDQVIQYLPSRGSADRGEVTIRTEVEQKGGFPIPINYEMYREDDDWRVYDISIDNISLVTNYRSSFAREIKSGGVQQLIDKLQQRNQDEQ